MCIRFSPATPKKLSLGVSDNKSNIIRVCILTYQWQFILKNICIMLVLMLKF